jgi:hypothetical protein
MVVIGKGRRFFCYITDAYAQTIMPNGVISRHEFEQPLLH